jgi:hypothetical protein
VTATENGVSGSETAGAREIVTVCYDQGWEELERLHLKTERVEIRQREEDKSHCVICSGVGGAGTTAAGNGASGSEAAGAR